MFSFFYFDSIDLKRNFGTRYRDGHVAAVQKKQNLKVAAASLWFVLLPGTLEKPLGAANLQSTLLFKAAL